MKTCNEIREVLAEMLDDSFEGAVRTEVEMHVNSCRECSRQLQQMQKIRNVLKSQPGLEVSAGFAAGLAAKIKAQTGAKILDLPARQKPGIKPMWSKLLAYAAGFGIMAIGFVALQQQGAFKDDTTLPVISNQPVISQQTVPEVTQSSIAAKVPDSVKSADKKDSLQHLKLVTPNEDKIYRVSHE